MNDNVKLIESEIDDSNPKIILTNTKTNLHCSLEICEKDVIQLSYFSLKKNKHKIISKYRIPNEKINQWGIEYQKNKNFLFFIELESKSCHTISNLSFQNADEASSFLLEYF